MTRRTKPGFNKNKLKAAQKQLKANIKGRKNLENIKNIIGKQKLAKKYIVSTWKPRTGQITINDRLETINEGGNNRNRNNSYGTNKNIANKNLINKAKRNKNLNKAKRNKNLNKNLIYNKAKRNKNLNKVKTAKNANNQARRFS
jgi:hypothetical protein